MILTIQLSSQPIVALIAFSISNDISSNLYTYLYSIIYRSLEIIYIRNTLALNDEMNVWKMKRWSIPNNLLATDQYQVLARPNCGGGILFS